MIINTRHNGKILNYKNGIKLPELTILTGENGSGKTQFLEFILHHAGGSEEYVEQESQSIFTSFFISDDLGNVINNVVYSYPGLKSSEQIYSGQASLINQILDRWNKLVPIAKSHSSIAHLKFDNETGELKSLNDAIFSLVRNLMVDSRHISSSSVKKATIDDLLELKKTAGQANKKIEDLTAIDYIIFYSIPTNIFSSALDLLFHQFHLKQKYYPELTKDVIPPWDVLNKILQDANYRYSVEHVPSENEQYPQPIRFVDLKKGVSAATIDSLSSGEKTIMALIFVLYHASNNGKFPQLILFDEPDAHLHPSLTELFLSVIKNVLVRDQKVNVILTTHSPSTIALSPPDCVFKMDRNLGYPVQADRYKAIQSLSNGLASMTIEEGNMGIEYILKRTNKPILFTEGITDKIIIEIAWKKLNPYLEQPFLVQDCFDAGFLGNLFRRGGQSPDGIFHISPDQKMVALFDFDGEGFQAWNSIKFDIIFEVDPLRGLTNSNGINAYKMLLPVPEIEEIKSQVIKTSGGTYKDKSKLTIEHLLFNAPNFKSLHFSAEDAAGGGLVYQIKSKKREFAKNCENLDSDHFEQFKKLFDTVLRIINS